jgi:hypothetical protein
MDEVHEEAASSSSSSSSSSSAAAALERDLKEFENAMNLETTRAEVDIATAAAVPTSTKRASKTPPSKRFDAFKYFEILIVVCVVCVCSKVDATYFKGCLLLFVYLNDEDMIDVAAEETGAAMPGTASASPALSTPAKEKQLSSKIDRLVNLAESVVKVNAEDDELTQLLRRSIEADERARQDANEANAKKQKLDGARRLVQNLTSQVQNYKSLGMAVEANNATLRLLQAQRVEEDLIAADVLKGGLP